MTLPISQQYRQTGAEVPYGTIWFARRTLQKRPYNLVLPYETGYRKCVSIVGPGVDNVITNEPGRVSPSVPGASRNPCFTFAYSSLFDPNDPVLESTVQLAREKAYGRLISELGETASLGVSLAEWHASAEMITRRSLQIIEMIRCVRRFDWGGFSRAAGLSKPKPTSRHGYYRFTDQEGKKWKVKLREQRFLSREERQRQFANNWLELAFGWSPAVQDIRGSCKVFTQELPDTLIRGGGSATAERAQIYYQDRNTIDSCANIVKTSCRIQVNVAITNPNLFLANQLGLLNLPAIGYDLIPFSFVLGWVTNVQTFLGQLTNFAGLSLRSACTTYKQQSECENTRVMLKGNVWAIQPGHYWTCLSSSKSFWRTNDIPSVKLRFRTPSISLGKSISSIALVAQRLKSES